MPGDPQEDAHLAEANQALYAHMRTIASQNTLLNLLRTLYGVGIESLRVKELSEKVARTILAEMSYEGIVCIMCGRDVARARIEAVAFSDRARAAGAATLFVPTEALVDSATFPVLNFAATQQSVTSVVHGDAWGARASVDVYERLSQEGHIKEWYVIPLVAGGGFRGVLCIGSNTAMGAVSAEEKMMLDTVRVAVSALVEKARVYDELEASNARLAELSSQKSAFLSFASHQLRTPLQSVIGYLSLLQSGTLGTLPAEPSRILTNVLDASVTMEKTIDDFLDASKIELGVMNYLKDYFDIQDLVHSVVFEATLTAQKKGLALHEQLGTVPCMVYADRAKIKHGLVNILDNAIKYTDTGSVTLTVVARDGSVHISIKDTGIGVDPSELETVFGKFNRGKTAQEKKIVGTGVGLFIAKQLIEAHGGTVRATSEGRGKGTEFLIVVPLSSPQGAQS